MSLTRSSNDANASGLFDGFFNAMPLVRMQASDWPVMKSGLSMDMKENADAFVCHVDVPGVPKEDVHLTVSEGVLTVAADFKREVKKNEGDKTHWVERSSGHVSRSVKLPDNVNAEEITATQNDGVLEIQIPKSKKDTHKTRRIKVA